MSNIVTRLRSSGADGDAVYMWNLCTEAADEIERLRADAERYRWLKTNIPIILSDVSGDIEIEKLDAAIDAAMKEEK